MQLFKNLEQEIDLCNQNLKQKKSEGHIFYW